MNAAQWVTSDRLDIGYLEWNRHGARSAVLVHGWPDAPLGWSALAALLVKAGYRVLAPALRGFAPTRFRDPATPRSGQRAALGRDLLAFCAALGLQRPLLIGHDWGARAAASAVVLQPQLASHLVLLSVGIGGSEQPLALEQARCYWYQWWLATAQGEQALRQRRQALTRQMWDTWSPPGWYAPAAFEAVLPAFAGEDWVEVVLHYYRHRWGLAAGDPAYAADEARLQARPVLAVPTLVLLGGADRCTLADGVRDDPALAPAGYQRRLLDRVGHFPQREAPAAVAEAILGFCQR